MSGHRNPLITQRRRLAHEVKDSGQMIRSKNRKGVHGMGEGDQRRQHMIGVMTVVSGIRAIHRSLEQAKLITGGHHNLEPISKLRPDDRIKQGLDNAHR
eukprot:278900-Amphidinium_carterae.1